MKPFAAALLSGVLFALALPPFNHGWLGWVALAPLCVAARVRRSLEAVGLGLLTGLTAGAVSVGWHSDTERLFWGWLPFFSLSALFGVMALFAAAPRPVWFLACVGVTLEWLTTFSPLPLNIALTQYQNLRLIQIVAGTGIWGISFLLWLANAAAADAVLRRKWVTRPLLWAVALSLFCWLDGWEQLDAHRGDIDAASFLRVAAIQDFSGMETGNLAPAPPENADADYEEMTRQAVRGGAKLVVWSEERLGTGFDVPHADPTFALARELKTYLVVGYQGRETPKAFNNAALVSPDGTVLGVHHKVHLYLGERQTTQTGGATRAFATPLGRVGMLICFDSCYTGITRQLAQSGAQIVAMPNYDPPAPRGVLHSLHSAFLPFRAVENHVAFVRADSNGLSQIVSPDGRILAQGPLFRPAIVSGTVTLGTGKGTLFTRFGDWLAYLCCFAIIFLLPRHRVHLEALETPEGPHANSSLAAVSEPADADGAGCPDIAQNSSSPNFSRPA